MKDKGLAFIVLAVLILADGASWFNVFAAAPPTTTSFYILDVGQGDAEMIEFAGGARVMTDAGPDAAVVDSFERALSGHNRSIDVAIISHPELDHFNGFNFLIEHYRVGTFVINGRDHPDSKQWTELLRKIKEKGIPLIALGAGDSIRYGPNRIDILSPDRRFIASGELNDTGIVERVSAPDLSVLLAADIGVNVESGLIADQDLRAEVLKVGHHGSKYSSGLDFLRAVHPAAAVIGVGAGNTYGHPAPAAIDRFKAAGIPIFRTDQRGTIVIRGAQGGLSITTER